jgi:hypothetical protein
LPRNTGRNKPCPCNSGKKRKHCHPQSRPPPLGRPARKSIGSSPRLVRGPVPSPPA